MKIIQDLRETTENTAPINRSIVGVFDSLSKDVQLLGDMGANIDVIRCWEDFRNAYIAWNKQLARNPEKAGLGSFHLLNAEWLAAELGRSGWAGRWPPDPNIRFRSDLLPGRRTKIRLKADQD